MKKKQSLRRSKLMGNESGQSTIELALTMIFLFSFVLFIFQLSMIFAFGNYVHYATFMAARAYLSSGPEIGDQKERARAVIVQMLKKSSGSALDKFPSFGKGFGGGDPLGAQIGPGSNYSVGVRDLSWMQGVRYKFRSRLFLMPLAGAQQKGNQTNTINLIELTSESWLGREPTFDECQSDMGKMTGIFDNGC